MGIFTRIKNLNPLKMIGKPSFFEIDYRGDNGKTCNMVVDDNLQVQKVQSGSEPNTCGEAMQKFRDNIVQEKKFGGMQKPIINPDIQKTKPAPQPQPEPEMKKKSYDQIPQETDWTGRIE